MGGMEKKPNWGTKIQKPKGTKGVVIQVDDIGTLHVAWETGSTLGVVPGVDMVRKPGEEIPRHKIF